MAEPRTFSEELKRWRVKMRLTQVQAAEALGVTYDALRNWELGRTDPANVGPLRKVMKLALEEAKQQS